MSAAQGVIDRDGRGPRPPPTGIVIGALLVVLAIPLVVVLAALRDPHWYPYADLAEIELRLRDVWSSNPPLIGAIGRFGPGGAPGSHPGPLGFYALWPFYRLWGANAWAMEVAAVCLHLTAMAVSLWIAHRRGGMRMVLAMAAVLAVLVHGYGPTLLADAWNPFVPLLWWLVFLLAVWSVVCDDVVLLPVAVFAGSLCAQSHVSYLANTVVLGLFAVGWATVRARRLGPEAWSKLLRWALGSLVLGAVLWLPPLIDELSGSPGNLSKIWDDFTNSSKVAIGAGRGVEILLVYLNPWKLLTHELGSRKIEVASGSFIPGFVLLAVWAAAACLAVRIGTAALRRLHLVLAVTLAIGVVSCSRIIGDLWSYLLLWIWVVSCLMVLAVAWTFGLLAARVLDPEAARRVATAVAVGIVVVIIAMVGLATRNASSAAMDDPRLSDEVGTLVGPTAATLRAGTRPGTGPDGRYLVTWQDPINWGMQGFGFVNELERRGFTVGTPAGYSAAVTPHRVMKATNATAIVHFAVGTEIAVWDRIAGSHRVAHFDARTPAQRAEYRRLRALVIGDLKSAGLHDRVPLVDTNLSYEALFDPQVPKPTAERMRRMIALGLDVAVFVAPPTAAPH